MRHLSLLTLMAAGVLAVAPAASAEILHFTANMDGAQETPPNASTGTGVAKVTLDTETKVMSWNIVYSGLSGLATMAHVHGPAVAGVAAPPVVKLGPAVDSPINGEAAVTAEQEKWLRGGMLYINVHTAAHPGGEIRGQLEMAH